MKYAFSPAGLSQLSRLGEGPALFAFDFDGTLAPIVPDSRRARLPASTRRLLTRLAGLAPVAAVSGRPLGDLRDRVPPNLRAWAGDHGAELFPRRFQEKGGFREARAVVRAWTRQLAESLTREPGVWLEEKDLSLCVHFRQSRNRNLARRRILGAVAALEPGPRALPGKCVVNLLNPDLPHKGNAMQTLMTSLGVQRALYVGDDSNDEDVFALADPRILTLRVGRRADSRAGLFLRRRTEIDRLLRFLLSLADRPRYRGGQ